MSSITAMVLARDCEDDIGPCLDSIAWADQRIVILDDRSGDDTERVARERGAKVVQHRFKNFAQQREFGLTLPTSEWTFYLDSDERATPELAREMASVIKNADYDGWWVPRRNFLWGHETRHGGWYPDYQLRLLRVGSAHYDLKRPVHEVVVLEGQAGHLENPLLHYNYRTLADFHRKQKTYAAYEADRLCQQGVHPHCWTYLSQPMRVFWRHYVSLQGYRDGLHGLRLCALTAYYYGFVTTVELARRWRQA